MLDYELLKKHLDCSCSVWKQQNIICFTMDIDWASEYAIEYAVSYFLKMEIPLTIFTTHKSDYLKRISNNPLIDIQIHPNFILPSSQGTNENEIIDYCMELVQNPLVFRAHRWYASNDIYEKLYSKGIRYESNLCTLFDNIEPYIHRSGMIGFPVFMEDGAIIQRGFSLRFLDTQRLFEQRGIKIINLHPMHFVLNTPYFKYTRDIKDMLSPKEWNELGVEQITKYRYNGIGITDYIKHLCEYGKGHMDIVAFRNLYSKFNDVTEVNVI